MKNIVFLFFVLCVLGGNAQEFIFKKKFDAFIFKSQIGKLDKSIKFYDALEFKDGYCIVGDSKNYGVVDSLGKIVVPMVYSGLNYFVDNVFVTKNDDRYGLVNSKNEEIFPTMAEEIKFKWLNKFSIPQFNIDGVNYFLNRSLGEIHKLETQDRIFFGVRKYNVMFDPSCEALDNVFDMMLCDNSFVEDKLNVVLNLERNFQKLLIHFIVTSNGEISDILYNRKVDIIVREKIEQVLHSIVVKKVQMDKGENVSFRSSVEIGG